MDTPPPASGIEPDEAPESRLAQELQAVPYEPLLPVEKRLIAWSLALGLGLLGLLYWVSATYFPVERVAGP